MPRASTQRLSIAYIRETFRNLDAGDGKGFFDHVADDVDWIVEGTQPLAGQYRSKTDLLANTFEKLKSTLLIGLFPQGDPNTLVDPHPLPTPPRDVGIIDRAHFDFYHGPANVSSYRAA